MARNNYQYEKRQRDIAKKKKQEEKRQKKFNKSAQDNEGTDQNPVETTEIDETTEE